MRTAWQGPGAAVTPLPAQHADTGQPRPPTARMILAVGVFIVIASVLCPLFTVALIDLLPASAVAYPNALMIAATVAAIAAGMGVAAWACHHILRGDGAPR